MTSRTFGSWLRARLLTREINAAELARRLGARPGVVSHWLNDKRTPSLVSCHAIAEALDIPVSHVMQAAGLPMEEEPDSNHEAEDQVVALFRRLTPDGQAAVVAFVEFQLGRERKGSAG